MAWRGLWAGWLLVLGVCAGAQSPAAPGPLLPLPPEQRSPPPPTTVGAVGEALFYIVPGSTPAAIFRSHAGQVAVIAPQTFALDRSGNLKGSLPEDVAAVAREQGVEIMPLVINASFSTTNAQRLLASASARSRAVNNLVDTADRLGLEGWQFDFEGLPASQREAYTRFVAQAAIALHAHGHSLSVAVAARTNDDPTTVTWRTFSGVYDYAGLGDAADFLSVMAYPESDSEHPGPLAGYPWVEQVIQHVLQSVPPDKVSLGVPTYQTDWTERRVRVSVTQKVGAQIKKVFHYVYHLVARNGAAQVGDDGDLAWDPVLQSSYRIEGDGHDRHTTWVEDERAFAAKLSLVAQYHLRGFSVWRVGLEDPHIWNLLPDAARATAVRPRS